MREQPKPPGCVWIFGGIRSRWPLLSVYERFEQTVALILTFFMILVIIAALWSLGVEVFALITHGISSGFTRRTFPVVFGSVMSLLIAMEFNHTIFHTAMHRGQIVRVKTVVLIAILAVSRVFVVLEAEPASANRIFAYALSVLFLGAVYYLMDLRNETNRTRDRPRRSMRHAARAAPRSGLR